MCILYRLRGVSVVFVVLGPLVVVLAACGPIFTFWRIQAKSVTVPVIISSFIFCSCTLCHVFPTYSVIRDFFFLKWKVKSGVTAGIRVSRGRATIVVRVVSMQEC